MPAPLQGSLRGQFRQGRWNAAAIVRWADRQNRVDDDPTTGSGLDPGPTPGYVVVDLEASWAALAGLEVAVGASNLLDATYADHLSRANLFDPVPVRVNEPGRTAWLRLRWRGGG